MSARTSTDAAALQDRVVSLVRPFGLHRSGETPCGKPIPVSEAHALVELAQDDGLTQSELGTQLRLEKSTITRLVGQLLARGWLERERHPSDGRAVLLHLTPRGLQAAVEIENARRQRVASLVDCIPKEDREQVLRALGVLTEALDDEP
jgi:DNA-binding MarR family transcriptional regulator